MRRTTVVTAAAVTLLSLQVFAGGRGADQRKAETIGKADKLFGQRYSPPAGKPLRLYDAETETGPPDAVIYWHAASYVIELVFANDGSVARVQLLPEALLHSDNWNNVPGSVELSRAEMQSVVESVDLLQSLGKPGEIMDPPRGCFQSGRNLYCTDTYELAVVSHHHFEKGHSQRLANIVLGEISIEYRQSVFGIVEDARFEGSQRQLKVGGYWYHGEKPTGGDIFGKAAVGSAVQFVTLGCAANEKVCLAIPEESKFGLTQ